MARRPTVSIVGCGRAGGAIGLGLRRAGYKITAVWSQSGPGRRRASRLLSVPSQRSPAKTAAAGEFVVVAVPDGAIAEVAADVAAGVSGADQMVVHCSGVTSIHALDPVVARGGRIGCLHPLQTLPDATRGAGALRGAAVAVTCDASESIYLHGIASAWGGVPFDLPDEAKPAYHAAAVFASNYLVACLWASTRLLERAGVPTPQVVLGPLARASVDNATEVGAARAMTGPIMRADVSTIRTHLAAIEDPRMEDAYRAMGRLVSSLAEIDERAVGEALL